MCYGFFTLIFQIVSVVFTSSLDHIFLFLHSLPPYILKRRYITLQTLPFWVVYNAFGLLHKRQKIQVLCKCKEKSLEVSYVMLCLGQKIHLLCECFIMPGAQQYVHLCNITPRTKNTSLIQTQYYVRYNQWFKRDNSANSVSGVLVF